MVMASMLGRAGRQPRLCAALTDIVHCRASHADKIQARTRLHTALSAPPKRCTPWKSRRRCRASRDRPDPCQKASHQLAKVGCNKCHAHRRSWLRRSLHARGTLHKANHSTKTDPIARTRRCSRPLPVPTTPIVRAAPAATHTCTHACCCTHMHTSPRLNGQGIHATLTHRTRAPSTQNCSRV